MRVGGEFEETEYFTSHQVTCCVDRVKGGVRVGEGWIRERLRVGGEFEEAEYFTSHQVTCCVDRVREEEGKGKLRVGTSNDKLCVEVGYVRIRVGKVMHGVG